MAQSNHILRTALAACFLASLTAGCTYGVAVRPAPSYDSFSFEARLPGSVAIHVDAEQAQRFDVIAAPIDEGENCVGTRYPVDAREALELSVFGTMERLWEEVAQTPTPLNREAMEAGGFDAVLVVRTDTFGAGVSTFKAGFLGFELGVEAGVEMVLAVSVFTRDGLVLRDFVRGNAVETDHGLGCDLGAEVLAIAVEAAMENTMTSLGDLVANAQDLRFSLEASTGR